MCTEGNTIWCPYGSFPVVIGVPPVPDMTPTKPDIPKTNKTRDGAVQRHRFAFSMLPMYPKTGQNSGDPEMDRLVASWLVRATDHLPQSWVENVAIQAWVAALNPPAQGSLAAKVEGSQ